MRIIKDHIDFNGRDMKMGHKILLGILCICFVILMPLLASAVSPGPTVSILTPIQGAAVSKPSVLVLVQIWDADGPVSINSGLSRVRRKIDTGAYSSTGIELTSRDCGTNCRIFQYVWDLSAYADDSTHTIRFIAYNDAGAYQASRSPGLSITVRGAKTGDGKLMVRDSSSQLCMDCHKIQGHSSQTSHADPSTPSAYGKWETICLDCHTAHNTTNIDLIRKTVNNYSYLATTAIPETVRFYNRTGNATGSYVNSSATGTDITGICQVCHTQTKNPTTSDLRWVSTGNPENGHYQDPTENCSRCHLHTEGFRGRDCFTCHKAPPDTGRHTIHGESARYVYGSLIIDSTVSTYGYDCGICHSGIHQNTGGPESNPHTVEVLFAGVAIQDPKSAATGTYAPASFETFTWNDYTFNYSEGTCSNTYCHGNYPGSGKNFPITHTEPAPSAPCGTLCHNALNDEPSIPITGSHERHVTSSARLTGETIDWHTYNREYSCTLCHGDLSGVGTPSSSGAYSSYTVVDKTKHVNGYVDWHFNTADFRTRDGYYSIASGTAVPSDGVTPRAYGYCTIYCHSNVQGNLGYGPPSVYSTMTWTTERNRCTNCHVDPSTSGTGTQKHGRGLSTGSHGSHYRDLNRNDCNDPTPCLICHNWSQSYVDTFDACTDQNCDVCHDTLNGTTSEKTKHVNGFIEVKIDTFYGGTYVKGSSFNPGIGYGDGSGSNCTNTYCHSDGTSIKTGTLLPNTSLDWGTEKYRQCYDCHSNTYYDPSDYRKAAPINISGTPPNAHQLHLRQSGSTVEDPSCAHCHYETTVDNASIASKVTHMNKVYDIDTGGTYPAWEGNEIGASKPVTIGTFSFEYGSSAVSTCTNVSCHPDGLDTNTAMWSNTYYCTECHKVDMDDNAGYHHVMYPDALTSRTYPLTAPSDSAADTKRKCIMCHVDHTTFNPMLNANSPGRAYNLRTSIFSSPTAYQYYTNMDFDNTQTYGGICTSCHQNAMSKNTTNRKNDNTTITPVVTKAIYNPSAHNYIKTSTFTSSQSGTFNANCSKCHNTGNDTKTFQNTTPKFATHDNKLRRLISQLGMSTTDEAQEESICFRCHSNTADAIGGTKKSADANDWFGSVTDMSAASRDVYAVMSSYSVTTSNALYFKNTSAENPVEPKASANLLNSGTYTDNTLRWRSMSPGAGSAQEFLRANTTNGSGQRYFRIAQFVSPPVNATTTFNSGSAYELQVYDVENNGDNNCKLNYVLYKWTADDALGTNIEALTTTGEFTTTLSQKTYSFSSDNAVTLNPGDKLLLELEILADSPTSTGTCDVYFGGGSYSSNLLLPASTGWRVPSGYRHNVAYYNGVHKPSPTDETQAYMTANRHVECTDCHNVHAATSTNALKSVWGIDPTNSTTAGAAPTSYAVTTVTDPDHQYKICFKCHSDWAGFGTGTNQAIEFNPNNESFHWVEKDKYTYTTNSGTGKGIYNTAEFNLNSTGGKTYAEWMMPRGDLGWTSANYTDANLRTLSLRCSDCHGPSAITSTIPKGPHGSAMAKILKYPSGSSYTTWSSTATRTNAWCLNCHEPLVHSTENTRYGTGMYGGGKNLHGLHGGKAGGKGGRCQDCHLANPHGQTGSGTTNQRKHLLSPAIFTNGVDSETSGNWSEHGWVIPGCT